MRNLHIVESPIAPAPLIERTVELDALRAAVCAGSGVVVLEAAAGLGKTTLLEHGAALAQEAGYHVRRAAPGPLEQDFGFGDVGALLAAPALAAPPPLARAAAADGAVLVEGVVPAEPSSMPIAHSVLWLCAGLAEEQPLVLVFDDAEWGDRASLEVLSYLAR